MAIYRNDIPADMPFANRKLCEFILEETLGNVNAFAKKIGVSQQMLDYLIKPDKATGKYKKVYPSIQKAVAAYYNISEAWTIETESSPIQQKVPAQSQKQADLDNSSTIEKLLEEIHTLIEVNDRNSQSIEKLVNHIIQKNS